VKNLSKNQKLIHNTVDNGDNFLFY